MATITGADSTSVAQIGTASSRCISQSSSFTAPDDLPDVVDGGVDGDGFSGVGTLLMPPPANLCSNPTAIGPAESSDMPGRCCR